MSHIYDFEDDFERMEWWIEGEEGALKFRRRNDLLYDSKLIVNFEMDTTVGKVLAHLATGKGTKRLQLDVNHFLATGSPFSMQVGIHSSRRTFLKKFMNILPIISEPTCNGDDDLVQTVGGAEERPKGSNVQLLENTAHKKKLEGKNEVSNPVGNGAADFSDDLPGATDEAEVLPAEVDAIVRSKEKGTKKNGAGSGAGDFTASEDVVQTMDEGDIRSEATVAVEENADKRSTVKHKSSVVGSRLPEDECSPESLQKHLIGDHLRIRLDLLVAPQKSTEVRPIDEAHAKKLKKMIGLNPEGNFVKLLLHIRRDAKDIEVEQLNSGEYTYEVIGGNHTRSALQALGNCDFVDAIVYAGLSDGQALCLGLQHNTHHASAKPVTFRNYVELFRKVWLLKTKDLEKPTQQERSDFKKYLSKMLRISHNSVCTRFRHHIYVVTLAPSLWTKAVNFMDMWEKGDILGQPKKTLSQYVVKLLVQSGGLEECLTKLCNKEMSWEQLKVSVQQKSQQKEGTDTHDENAKDELDVLHEEVRALKRENAALTEEVRVLRRKLEEAEKSREMPQEDTARMCEPQLNGNPTTTERMDEGEVCVEKGKWVGVEYDSECFIGKVLGLLRGGIVKVQFLENKLRGSLSRWDTQKVDRQYIVCVVDNVKNCNGVYSLPEAEERKLEKNFRIYQQRCL